MTTVFISHSTKDSRFVQERLKPLVEGGGMSAWVSEHDIPMAAEWERRIQQALKDADWILVVLSPEAVSSDWVKSEAHWALEKRPGRVIPILLRECDPADLHLKLLRIQFVDFRGDLEAAAARLLDAIRHGTGPAPLTDDDDVGGETVVLTGSVSAELVLKAVGGPQESETFDLVVRGECTLGRATDCDLHIDDNSVSRRHARLSSTVVAGEKRVLIHDLNSANGTYVNHRRLEEPHSLVVGDVIDVGRTRLLVEQIDSMSGAEEQASEPRGEGDTPKGIEIDLAFSGNAEAPERHGLDPMRILVIGDLGARAHRGAATQPLADRSTPAVDVDTFEELMARLIPRLELPIHAGGKETSVRLEFRSLDDFHPDRIFREAGLFRSLRDLRARLRDPAAFAEAAQELREAARAHQVSPPADAPSVPASGTQSKDETDRETLARLLDAKEATAPGGTPPPQGAEALIRAIVAPHIVPGPDPLQEIYLRSVDEAISEQMRAILHHSAFQELEAAWRGIHRLITRMETGEVLQVHLLDATKAELLADVLAAREDLSRSGLNRLLVERGVEVTDGAPWSLLVCDFSFGPGPEDIALLAGLGAVASRAGGPVLAAADPLLLGCKSLAETPDPEQWQVQSGDDAEHWDALRRNPVARWIGLALPRVLMRLPYGKGGEEVESFAFEELPRIEDHEGFLWGSPAMACGELIGGSFLLKGWEMKPGDLLDVDDLPAFSFTLDGEVQLLPCAEIRMPEHTAETILKVGVMPLMSYRNRDAVRVLRFQSVADRLVSLGGGWK